MCWLIGAEITWFPIKNCGSVDMSLILFYWDAIDMCGGSEGTYIFLNGAPS